ncbi:hypothetical protein JCM8097_003395 [Rhodosporidiobolus ruineniae]
MSTAPPHSPPAADAARPVLDDLASTLSSLNLQQQVATPLRGDDEHEAHPSASQWTPLATLDASTAALAAPTSLSSSSPPLPRTSILFQPACLGHRYIRNSDIGTIVERPERIRAVKVGVAAAFARLEGREGKGRWEAPVERSEKGEDELDELLGGLSLAEGAKKADKKGKGRAKNVFGGGPFDILESSSILGVDHPAVRLVHPAPNHAPTAEADAAWIAASSSSSSSVPSTSSDSSKPATPSRLTRALSASPSKPHPSLPPPVPKPWPEQLLHLCRRAPSALLTSPFSEIPPHLLQGDLYLAPESEEAIFGALGAVCEGVDRAVRGERVFTAIRPPGHHCGEANPQGFCFVNNVAVAAAHAYLDHGINRVAIFDIDLHHGNGTQELVYRINAEARRILLERKQKRDESKTPSSSPRKGNSPRKAATPLPPVDEPAPLRIFYGSLHDIWSYPCEDGDPSLVSAASLNLSGGHGQYIANVHLEPYATEDELHEVLYPRYQEGLVGKAEEFVRKTRPEGEENGEKVLVIVSAGFDASQHEYPSMSRHARHVPTSFYRRFARDAVRFAAQFADGKVLAVLEGGYSDRALASATAAFLTGFVGAAVGSEMGADEQREEEDAWWAEAQLKKLERACSAAKPPRRGPSSACSSASGLVGPSKGDDPYLARAVEIFARIEGAPSPSYAAALPPAAQKEEEPAVPMQLRERRMRHNYAGLDVGAGPAAPSTSSSSGAAAAGGQGRRAVSAPAMKAQEREKKAQDLPPLPPLPPAVPAVASASSSSFAPGGDGGETAPAEGPVKVKFTWKQGGFMGEPRM